MKREMRRIVWLAALLGLAWNCRDAAPQGAADNGAEPYSTLEERALNEAFRIDIQDIEVTFDYYPESRYADGLARLEFTMREGQSVPRFHFTPAMESPAAIRELRLDGEALQFAVDARVAEVTGSSQRIVELQRSVAQGAPHVLEVGYRLELPAAYPRFSTNVNDLAGRGNEDIFPTLNSPGELARHRLTLRVHGSAAYRCLASGLVSGTSEPGVQSWTVDSEQAIASYTLLFALMPAADTLFEERRIAGVPVRIMAWRGGASIAEALATLQGWLPQLQAEIGPYPAARGLNVFLVSAGGGMEYYGGTITSIRALRHEVVHNYFGCSTVLATYRDTWLDEAIAQWFDDTAGGIAYTALPDGYEGNWVGSRAPVSVGFSDLAYTDGARIMQYIADRLGGRAGLVSFLAGLQRDRSLQPFTTMEFAGFLRAETGLEMEAQFRRWLFAGQAGSSLGAAATARKRPDLTPPAWLLKRRGGGR